jgi:uncharacterized membrane protein
MWLNHKKSAGYKLQDIEFRTSIRDFLTLGTGFRSVIIHFSPKMFYVLNLGTCRFNLSHVRRGLDQNWAKAKVCTVKLIIVYNHLTWWPERNWSEYNEAACAVATWHRMPDEPSGGAGWLHRKLSTVIFMFAFAPSSVFINLNLTVAPGHATLAYKCHHSSQDQIQIQRPWAPAYWQFDYPGLGLGCRDTKRDSQHDTTYSFFEDTSISTSSAIS